MNIKKTISILIFLIVINTTYAVLEGYTVTGRITDDTNKPAYNSEVLLYSTAMGCDCYSEKPDYTSSTGYYSSSADNLVFMNNCNIFAKGDSCTQYVNPESDKVWIYVKGYSALPKPLGDKITIKTNWNNYELKGTVFYGLNNILSRLTTPVEEEVEEKRINSFDEFWITPAVVALTNSSTAEPEIDDTKVVFSNEELKNILGEKKLKEIIEEIPSPSIKTSIFGWFDLSTSITTITTLLVIMTIILIALISKRSRDKEKVQ